jgi:DNA polymerase IV
MTIKKWPRVIALADMNAFFASIEQVHNPMLAGKPIGITNGLTGTCIITSSYEARSFGVKTGMRVKEAEQLCPGFIQIPANPVLYAQVSTQIMESLQDISPDIEVFSVDEAFLDLTRCKKIWNTEPEVIGMMIKRKVYSVSGIKCSVGISGDKSTAKWAAKLMKPDGLTIIPPWEAQQRLRGVPVTELCGVNKGIGGFLAKRGAFTCGDVAELPISVLGQRFGNPGKRIWYMCQGKDPDKVENNIQAPKSIGHGKVMPPNTKDKDVIYMYLVHMAEKVGQRLRQHSLRAQQFSIALRAKEEWLGSKFKTAIPTNDSQSIVLLCKFMLKNYWHGEGVFQVQVTAKDPHPEKGQLDMFTEENNKTFLVNKVIDKINDRYGEFTMSPASILNRSDMPNVIAPAWKPYGHRQTIQDANLLKKT